MPTPETQDAFVSIDPEQLAEVAGGTSKSSNDQLTAMLTQIGSSIKDLAASKNSGQSMDPMMMMMMMMMMGGGGGGGGIAAPAAVAPPVINVDTGVSGGGGGGGRCRGKKGW